MRNVVKPNLPTNERGRKKDGEAPIDLHRAREGGVNVYSSERVRSSGIQTEKSVVNQMSASINSLLI